MNHYHASLPDNSQVNLSTDSDAQLAYLRSLDLATRASRFTLQEPTIQFEDLNLLFKHFLCDPSFFAEARPHVLEHYFHDHEVAVRCVWMAMCSRYPAPFTVEGIVSAIHEYRSSQPQIMISPDVYNLLTGPHNRVGEWLATPRESLDIGRARTVLKRFLYQRSVFLPTRQYVGSHGPNLAPADIVPFLQHAIEQSHSIETLFSPPPRTMGDIWDEHESRLAITRGRDLVGLQTGLTKLDEKLLGLRGLTLLGAMPSVGKTALCLQIALGVCGAHAFNDAVVVFISLEMTRDELMTRAKCMLSRLDWSTYVLGSVGYRNGGENVFSPEHLNCIQFGRQRMIDQQIDRRLCIIDRSQVGDDLSSTQIQKYVNDIKSRANASRALVVLDYLQLLSPGKAGLSDLEADKQRMRVLQDVVNRSRMDSNPIGDALIAISEARKPAGATENNRKIVWGQRLQELMGSARLGYGADAVLLYRRMSAEDIKDCYSLRNNDQIERQYETLENSGISPVILTVEKGRDGTKRGEIPMEFHYQQNHFTELSSRSFVTPSRPSRLGDRAGAAEAQSEMTGQPRQSSESSIPIT
ncbi:DnaB-like helicase C-terminal domain-containing protein [Bremerella sp. T1]|uniref:DnaB-like helicase C-terminal domain-containing protein n=1 Tax=Bremerella sp. TYQ1 TaxID=3119568 RepID=UPI001CC94813|nr:DnaB-like helicase C-terminal domain-containing protein [Bremerella volcania]UBM33764.1 AAA family ATPase [Bremerella volcania]